MKESWPYTTTILTGSTLSRLFRKGVRYPVGRVKRLVVTPFSFYEFLLAGKKDLLCEKLKALSEVSITIHHEFLLMLNSYLTVGGLPVVVKDYFAKRDFQHSLGSIVADYEQDFIRLFGENDLAIVKACLHSVANFTGSPSKNSSVVPSPTTMVHHKINNKVIPIECKSALKIKKTHLKGVISYLEMYGQKKAVVISLSPQEHIFVREKFEIINIPLYAAENIWDIV